MTTNTSISKGRARTLIDNITTTAESAGGHLDSFEAELDAMTKLVISAHKTEAWKALDYTSWGECCEKEFGSVQKLRLPVEHRRKLHKTLNEGGLSVRECAKVTKRSPTTVHGDLVFGTGTGNEAPEISTSVLAKRVDNYLGKIRERVATGITDDIERKEVRKMYEAAIEEAQEGLAALDGGGAPEVVTPELAATG